MSRTFKFCSFEKPSGKTETLFSRRCNIRSSVHLISSGGRLWIRFESRTRFINFESWPISGGISSRRFSLRKSSVKFWQWPLIEWHKVYQGTCHKWSWYSSYPIIANPFIVNFSDGSLHKEQLSGNNCISHFPMYGVTDSSLFWSTFKIDSFFSVPMESGNSSRKFFDKFNSSKLCNWSRFSGSFSIWFKHRSADWRLYRLGCRKVDTVKTGN